MKKPLTIVLTGGGSGGHITPLLSLAHALKRAEPKCRVVYIGLKGDTLEDSLQKRYQVFDEVRAVPSGKFRRYHGESLLAHLIDWRTLVLNTRDFFRVLAGAASARRLLKKIKPDVVFSKGGFVVVPVGLAARWQKIPLVTHDSDAVPGLANRLIGRFAVVHATGMPADYYSYPRQTIHFVGVPLDERIKPVTAEMQKSFKKQLGLPLDSPVLLVGGAGLGARDVNNTILEIASELLGRFKNLHLIHVAGRQHAAEVSAKYHGSVPDEVQRITVLDFTPDFYKYTGAADLVITRAGATTIAELAAQRKAVILIPAPHLTGGHQIKNAEELKKHRAALVIDNDAKPSELLKTVSAVLEDQAKRRQLAENLGSLAKVDAADKLAELLLMVADKPKMTRDAG
jgi:UDP-N-acetylglucosamine--N-acetylmuramyl-(pentapeptide) pyrophosphoryl-undecaprenol N-acetylglucosamine transferase